MQVINQPQSMFSPRTCHLSITDSVCSNANYCMHLHNIAIFTHPSWQKMMEGRNSLLLGHCYQTMTYLNADTLRDSFHFRQTKLYPSKAVAKFLAHSWLSCKMQNICGLGNWSQNVTIQQDWNIFWDWANTAPYADDNGFVTTFVITSYIRTLRDTILQCTQRHFDPHQTFDWIKI